MLSSTGIQSDPPARGNPCSDLGVPVIDIWQIVCTHAHTQTFRSYVCLARSGRCELCAYVPGQRCRLTRWERSQRCGVVISYRKVNFPGEPLKTHPYTQVWFLSVSSVWWRTHNPGDGVCHSFALCRAAASSLPDHSPVPGGQPRGQSHHW